MSKPEDRKTTYKRIIEKKYVEVKTEEKKYYTLNEYLKLEDIKDDNDIFVEAVKELRR